MIYAGTFSEEDSAVLGLIFLIILVILVVVPLMAIFGLVLLGSGLRQRRAATIEPPGARAPTVGPGVGIDQPPGSALGPPGVISDRGQAKIGVGLALLAPFLFFLLRLLI